MPAFRAAIGFAILTFLIVASADVETGYGADPSKFPDVKIIAKKSQNEPNVMDAYLANGTGDTLRITVQTTEKTAIKGQLLKSFSKDYTLRAGTEQVLGRQTQKGVIKYTYEITGVMK